MEPSSKKPPAWPLLDSPNKVGSYTLGRVTETHPGQWRNSGLASAWRLKKPGASQTIKYSDLIFAWAYIAVWGHKYNMTAVYTRLQRTQHIAYKAVYLEL